MTVKIMIKRKVPKQKKTEFLKLINGLRTEAIKQPGYISGEVLSNADHPEQYLVISTWNSPEEWLAWKSSKKRAELQAKIDTLLDAKTQYDVYHYLL
ncbi:MAG: antibiotic biosynthesis monooxygenase [Deltaproteobacteria bacterium]|nr:antibiotic biosynthesis monooxygenase [Deltaproteobacteria bacterium]